MNSTQFANYVRKQTRTNASTFSDADILLYANIEKDYLVSLIEKADEDYFGVTLNRDLEADKRRYGLPSYLLRGITRIDAKFDGTNVTHLGEVVYDDFNRPFTETDIRSYMAGLTPGWMIFGKEIYILNDAAIDDVPDGLTVYATIYPADLSALNGTTDLAANPSTQTVGMPRQLHKSWADLVVIDYKNSKDKPIPLTKQEQNINGTLATIINALVPLDTGAAFVAPVPHDDGSSY
jgi:hypothetical protein